jgi:hypothetical protein
LKKSRWGGIPAGSGSNFASKPESKGAFVVFPARAAVRPAESVINLRLSSAGAGKGGLGGGAVPSQWQL